MNKSELIKSSVSLNSCEAESAVSTNGESGVTLEHKDSKCVRSVIEAKNLALECFLGINVLTNWLITNDAIEVLLKESETKINDLSKIFNQRTKTTRLHNICIHQ